MAATPGHVPDRVLELLLTDLPCRNAGSPNSDSTKDSFHRKQHYQGLAQEALTAPPSPEALSSPSMDKAWLSPLLLLYVWS